MSVQKRPYELSVWDEELIGEGKKEEYKILIIGAHDMTYNGRAVGIKLTRKVNGTNSLTFQMLSSFFDSKKGEFVGNEYIDELYAERKIKLHYKDKWYEFYIKGVQEEKKHNSVLKTFSCEDAFIDELARNGYGITFDEELYNNVEEIGVFTEEILEDSVWEYAPEYNWGDFTEYTEEKLFKINMNNFKDGIIHAYKLTYNYDDFNEDYITNINTNETRNIEMGDDLARAKGYYWDQYSDTGVLHQLKTQPVELKQKDYEYIYIPYSSLNFCYINSTEEEIQDSHFIPNHTATEMPAHNENNDYYIAPFEINPNTLIQFIAFTASDLLEIDEAGLIVNKDCHYVMTLQEWNKMNTNTWYIFNDVRYVETTNGIDNDVYSMSYNFKHILNNAEDQQDKGNKCITYEGYLNNLKNNEIIKGKKISIADRTEMNISKDIDAFVTVYNQKSDDNEIKNYYSNEEWNGDYSNYRICSRSSTRQIIPTLARNYIQNGSNIEGTTGWEAMTSTENAFIEPTVAYRTSNDENNNTVETFIAFLTGEDPDTQSPAEDSEGSDTENSITDEKKDKYTIINFGAVSQEKIIKKDQVYCLGLKVKIKKKKNQTDDEIPFTITIAKGYLRSTGAYELGSEQISFNLEDFYKTGTSEDEFDELTDNEQPWKTLYANLNNKEFNEEDLEISGMFSELKTKYILFKADVDIESPYIAITSSQDYLLSDIELFEAYTKGKDCFTDGYYQLSGRDFYFPQSQDDLNSIQEIVINSAKKLSIYRSDNIKQEILFENDIMVGSAYEYQKYFIQQLQLLNKANYDTFMCKSYLSEDGNDNALPLSSALYDEDDFKIVTNIIDLTKCKHYLHQSQGCNYNNNICYYQKYGYCPYLFTSEKHCRKIRTLKGEKSNRFNLTQEVSKVFKCYPVYHISHNPNGTIMRDDDGKMIKKVYYITDKGRTSIYGFRYGKNLSNISRNIVSNQIVTKLYVNDVDSEYSNTGLCSIKTAPDNPSKDSFIIDFSYYITKGLLPAAQVEQDLYGITHQENEIINGYLKSLGNYNTQYDTLTNKIINLQNNSFNDIDAHLQINIEGINVINKEIKEYNDMKAKYSNQPNSNIYKSYQAKLREAQATLYNLLFTTFEPIENNEIVIDLLKWFEEQTEDKSFDDIIKEYRDEHKWDTGLLGQYNKEYLQIQNWKKERAKYLKLANNLTSSFFKKYEPYLKEGTWSDTNYLTDNAYYYGALDVSAQGAIPKIEYSISVLDLSPFEEYSDYELDNGDITYIEDISILGYNKNTGFPNRLKVMVSEIDENLDVPTNNSIKVQNFTTQFEDLFQQVTATVQNLTLNENIYRRASNFTSTHNIQEESLQNTLSSNNFTLVNNAQKNIVVDQNGQSGSNINNRTSQYKLTGQGLYFSRDGGVSWKKSMSPDQKTDLDIKTRSVETEKIDLIGSSNQINSSLTSYGLECYNNITSDNVKAFNYDNDGLSYTYNNTQLLQVGILDKDSSEIKYGFLLRNGNNTIFNAVTSLVADAENDIEINADLEVTGNSSFNGAFDFTGDGIFNGKNVFKNGNFSFTTGAKIDNGLTVKVIEGEQYKLKIFSIANNEQNIFTIFADGSAIMGGTISIYSEDYPDYIQITNGKAVKTEE